MKSFFASALGLLAAASLSAAVVTGGGTGTPTTPTAPTTPTTPTTPVVTPKPTTGGCQKPAAKLATKPVEKKCDEKKAAPKPAPIKSAAPVCKKK